MVIRLVVYYKVKNAKNFGGMWSMGAPGGESKKTSSHFSIPFFKNNVILTGTEYLTMNTRLQNHANPFVLCCGRSEGGHLGSGRLFSEKAGL